MNKKIVIELIQKQHKYLTEDITVRFTQFVELVTKQHVHLVRGITDTLKETIEAIKQLPEEELQDLSEHLKRLIPKEHKVDFSFTDEKDLPAYEQHVEGMLEPKEKVVKERYRNHKGNKAKVLEALDEWQQYKDKEKIKDNNYRKIYLENLLIDTTGPMKELVGYVSEAVQHKELTDSIICRSWKMYIENSDKDVNIIISENGSIEYLLNNKQFNLPCRIFILRSKRLL